MTLNSLLVGITMAYILLMKMLNNKLSEDEVFFKLFVLLYVDDTIILAESAEELNVALKAVYEYCSVWKLSVNTSKSKVVICSQEEK
jgi:hypothetical protein